MGNVALSTPIYNPPVPYRGSVAGGGKPGMSIHVQGNVNQNPHDFRIDLVCGSHHSADVAFVFNPRFSQNEVVRNTQSNGQWGAEEKHGGFPFSRGAAFDVRIDITSNEYKVYVNNRHFADYRHRTPVYRVDTLSIEGSVTLTCIRFENRSAHGGHHHHGHHQPSHAPGFPPSAPGFPPSAPGFPPSAPGFPPSAPGFPPSAPGGFPPSAPGFPPSAPGFPPSAPGGFPPSAPGFPPSAPGFPPSAPGFPPSAPGFPPSAPGYPPSGPPAGGPGYGSGLHVRSPPMPFKSNIPGGMYPGRMVNVSGTPASFANTFAINLQIGQFQTDVALHFNPRFGTSSVVRNSMQRGGWGPEENQSPYFPFAYNRPFNITILCEQHQFKIAVNGQHFVEYRHRFLELHRIDTIAITGDVVVDEVRVQ